MHQAITRTNGDYSLVFLSILSFSCETGIRRMPQALNDD